MANIGALLFILFPKGRDPLVRYGGLRGLDGTQLEHRIGVAFHGRGDDGVEMGTDILGSMLQRGVGVLDVGALVGHPPVLLDGGGTALVLAAEIAGDVAAAVEYVDRGAAHPVPRPREQG